MSKVNLKQVNGIIVGILLQYRPRDSEHFIFTGRHPFVCYNYLRMNIIREIYSLSENYILK